jgi:ribosomal protein S18 acetylase RimI-like enzyme
MSTRSGPLVLELRRYDARSYGDILVAVGHLYAEIYREPPYNEGPDDAESFIEGMPQRAAQPAFQMIVAFADSEPVGFTFGHQLAPDTQWWEGAVTAFPEAIVRESVGRTFAIIELAVLAPYRRRGIAKTMHNALLANRSEERVTLLVRPEAAPARTAYRRWGYVRVGSIRPWRDAPLYDAMVLDLRRGRGGGGP